MFEYRTPFTLTNIVTSEDFNKAKEYVAEENMVQYLIHEDANDLIDKIEEIRWHLRDVISGYVKCISKVPLTEDELYIISQFVSGQNSDGLGEGFEQRFLAEFDWETNDYIFTEYSTDKIVESAKNILSYCNHTDCSTECIFCEEYKKQHPTSCSTEYCFDHMLLQDIIDEYDK